MDTKKRRVVSYENMDEVLKAAFDEKYPKGANDYIPEVNRYDKPDGTFFHAVTVETADTIALVKVNINVDAVEDIEKWLNEDDGAEDESGSDASGDNIPDDNISMYSNGEDDSADAE